MKDNSTEIMRDTVLVLKIGSVINKGGPETVRHAVEDVVFSNSKVIFARHIESEDMFVFNIVVSRETAKNLLTF